MIKLEYFNNEDTWIQVVGVLQDSLSDETTLDESYDNATIKARNENTTICEPFTKFRVFDGVEWRYYIGSETVQRVQMSKYYLHTYRLTEPTKIIERYKLSGLSVTQPPTGDKKDLLFVINRALKDVNTRYNKNFALSDNERLQAVLLQECPEFSVTKKTTLFELLYDYIGKFINAMPRVLGNVTGLYNKITFDFFQDLTKVDIEINETALEYSKSEENASTYIETEVSNLVVENADNEGSIVYPYVDGWITPRSDSIRLTSDTAVIQLPHNIKTITNFEIYIENFTVQASISFSGAVAGKLTGRITSEIEKNYNITSNILTEEQWLALDEIKTADWNSDDVFKNNTLYYTVGSNKIENLSKTYKSTIFSDSYVLSYLVATAIYNKYKGQEVTVYADKGGSDGVGNWSGKLLSVQVGNFEPKNLKYRVTYIPYIDTVTAQINPYGIEKGSLTYNQSAETVNAQALGESMWLELQNQNTTTYQKTARYDNVGNILKVGDIIDNKIITNVSRAFTGSKWINVLYKSNEDFIRKSQYIQENREYRPYLIPATTIVDRHIHTDDYCYIGYSNVSDGITFRTLFIESFIKESEKNDEISNILITTNDKDEYYYDDEITSVVVPATSIALGHSVQFDWSMVDNFSAGKYIENPSESTPTVKQADYTKNGKISSFSIMLNPIFNSGLDPNKLPLSTSVVNSSYYVKYYDLDKDEGEKLSGSIQLHFLPNENDVIVSSNLAKDCPLISNKNYSFTLAFTNENLNKYTNSLKEDYITVPITKELNSEYNNIGNEKISVKLSINTTIPTNYKHWALIDEKDNLYCAGLTNKIVDGIYFSFISKGLSESSINYLIYELSQDKTYYSVAGVNMDNVNKGNIRIPNNYNGLPVKEINRNAFLEKNIINVIIPIGITKIGNGAFFSCENLQTVTYNAKNCQDISSGNNSPFRNSGNNLTVTIGNDAETIPAWMFANSYVKTLEATGTSLLSINEGAFNSCYDLSSITLSDTITSIGNDTFSYCAFTSVTIPKNIQSIGKYAFTSVSSVYYYGGNVYNLIKGVYEDTNVRFGNDVTIYANIMNDGYPQVFSDKTLIIPYSPNFTSIDWNGTTDIKRIIIDPRIKVPVKSGAFAGFSNLQEVWIPLSMKSVNAEGTKLISLIEEGAFTRAEGSTGIKKVYFEGSYEEWEIVSRKYWSDQYETYVYGIGIPYSATIKYNQPMYKYENK